MIPVPGKQYIVVKGDTLWDIAAAAYGNPRKWEIIYNANKAILRDPTIYPNTVVLIYPGEILNIPYDSELENIKSENGAINDRYGYENLRFIVDGNEINVESGRCVLCIDTIADGFSFIVNTENAPKIKPFGFEKCDVYIDDTKLISGIIYSAQSESSNDGESVSISGFSGTKDILDSNTDPPFSYMDKTLFNICKLITKPFSVSVIDNVSDAYVFKKANIDSGEKIGDFLLRLAYQRGVLLRSNSNGDIEIIRANTNGGSILSITESTDLSEQISFSYDSSNRFSKYVATGRHPKRNIKGVFKDSSIIRYRVSRRSASDVKSDEIKKPAEWMCRTSKARSVNVGFSMPGFYDKNGNVIRENNTITIGKQSLFMIPGEKMLINSVEFEQSDDGKFSRIECVLPSIYTDEDSTEPWKTLGQ